MPKRSLENNGKKDNSTYNIISDILDFVPIVGGINRFARGESKEGVTNLILDSLTPSLPLSVAGKTIFGPINKNSKIAIADFAHYAKDANNSEDFALAAEHAIDNYGVPSDDPGDSFLLNDKQQEEFMNNLGYFKTNDEDGIKKIKKATNALTRFRLGRKPNIYQIGEDEIPRDSVIPIDFNDIEEDVKPYARNVYDLLKHAGPHPTIYYKHKNPNKKEYYYRDIDLNDYGNHNKTGGTKYNNQWLADIYDFIGNPFIQKSGLTRIDTTSDNNSEYTNNGRPQKYIQFKVKRQTEKDGGSIHIAPSKRGTFTAAATKHGMSVQEFASSVLRNKDNYSPAMVKKANFARNASKWNH